MHLLLLLLLSSLSVLPPAGGNTDSANEVNTMLTKQT